MLKVMIATLILLTCAVWFGPNPLVDFLAVEPEYRIQITGMDGTFLALSLSVADATRVVFTVLVSCAALVYSGVLLVSWCRTPAQGTPAETVADGGPASGTGKEGKAGPRERAVAAGSINDPSRLAPGGWPAEGRS